MANQWGRCSEAGHIGTWDAASPGLSGCGRAAAGVAKRCLVHVFQGIDSQGGCRLARAGKDSAQGSREFEALEKASVEKKGEVDQAIADFRKAVEIDPSDQDAKEGLKRLGVMPRAGLAPHQS